MTTEFFTTRNDAIQALIIDPIEASGTVTAAEFDIEKIADDVLEYDPAAGFYQSVTAVEFWFIVADNALEG